VEPGTRENDIIADDRGYPRRKPLKFQASPGGFELPLPP
jgi:hypothetical protein